MNNIIFTYSRSGVKNEKLIQKDGWYKINIGKLNAFNRSGEFYPENGIRDLVNDPTSYFGAKLAEGYLKGEREHPSFEPGMTKHAYILRLLHIDPKNVSHHIKSIEFEDTGIPPGRGMKGSIINITAWIKPDAGPLGQALKADLDDPEINVAFSIRSLVKPEIVNGITCKNITNLITFDWVHMPGMDTANKFDSKDKVSAGLESFDSRVAINNISDADIQMCIQMVNSAGLGLESDKDTLKLLDEMGNKKKTYGIFNKW